MGTASTMACLAEALGMAPLGSSTPPAVSAARLRVAEKVGGIAARLAGATADVSVDSDIGTKVRPRDVLKRMNFENAITYVSTVHFTWTACEIHFVFVFVFLLEGSSRLSEAPRMP